MKTGAKRSVLTLHKKIAKDAQRTAVANAKGGRYYKATVADRIAAVTGRKT